MIFSKALDGIRKENGKEEHCRRQPDEQKAVNQRARGRDLDNEVANEEVQTSKKRLSLPISRTPRKKIDEKSAQTKMLRSALTPIKEGKSSEASKRKISVEKDTYERKRIGERVKKLESNKQELPDSPPTVPEDPKPSNLEENPAKTREEQKKMQNKATTTTAEHFQRRSFTAARGKMANGRVGKDPDRQRMASLFGTNSHWTRADAAYAKQQEPLALAQMNGKMEEKGEKQADNIPGLPATEGEGGGLAQKQPIRPPTPENSLKKSPKNEINWPAPSSPEKTPTRSLHTKVTMRNKRKLAHLRKRRISADDEDEKCEAEEEEEQKVDESTSRTAPRVVAQDERTDMERSGAGGHTPRRRQKTPSSAKSVKEEEEEEEIPKLPKHASPTKTPRRQEALDHSGFLAPFFTKAFAFSNHFKCFFYVDRKRFCCTEQFYMYYKARVFGDMQSAKEIMQCTEARDMKRAGSKIRNFDTAKWRKMSILVMTIGNMKKYAQNPELRRLLFDTGDAVLVEASPDDIYWGTGVGLNSASIRDVKNWPGKNVLGRILTRIREVLKSRPEFRAEWELVKRRTI